MRNKKKYNVQEIEKITGINRKQLYEYDLLGIVKPVEVDENNHYKYYDEETVRKIALISLLVALGDTPRILQRRFKDKSFNIDKEIDEVLERVNKQIIYLGDIKKTAEELKSTEKLTGEIKKKNNSIINIDDIVPKIAALGVPGLILMISIGATGLAGAAALTTTLAALGPFGMIGGIATLGLAGLLSEAITKFGFDTIFESVVKELYKNGESKKSIIEKIEKYRVSNELKNKLKEKIDNIKES